MNNLILGAIAGIGSLCLIVVMSYESGVHDERVRQEVLAGKQMAKNQVITQNNDTDSNNIASVVMGANKLMYNSLITNTETVVQLVPINTKCDFESNVVTDINKRGK